MVLVEAYLQQNQKYYSFHLNSSVLSQCFDISDPKLTNKQVHEHLLYFKKVTKISKRKKVGSVLENFKVILEIANIQIEGEELFFRKCSFDL